MVGIYYRWNDEKNEQLKLRRGLCFEQVIMHVDKGDLLDIIAHPNQIKYPNQEMLVVSITGYAYLIPFAQQGKEFFLKTIIPSRKATRKYLRGKE